MPSEGTDWMEYILRGQIGWSTFRGDRLDVVLFEGTDWMEYIQRGQIGWSTFRGDRSDGVHFEGQFGWNLFEPRADCTITVSVC